MKYDLDNYLLEFSEEQLKEMLVDDDMLIYHVREFLEECKRNIPDDIPEIERSIRQVLKWKREG